MSRIRRRQWKKIPLKKTYYIMLGGLIVLPILLVFLGSFYVFNQQYKEQAIENIKQMHQTLIANLTSDLDDLAMRMTTMIYSNDYEVMQYAAGTNTANAAEKDRNRKQLHKIENLYLGPNKEVISMYFRMKNGEDTFLKSYINREREEVQEWSWYQKALKQKDQVYVGSFETTSSGDLFVGGKKGMFILAAVLSPDINTDKSGKIEMVELYQASGVADRIRMNNKDYLNGKNCLGMVQITDEIGNCLFATVKETNKWEDQGYICIKTPMKVYDTTWYIESYVKPEELTEEFQRVGMTLFAIAFIILIFLSYFSSYFIKSIVKPIEEVNQGLRDVEAGHLDVHITARGQFEIRTMIHQFNAMVRQLRSFFKEYEEKLQLGRNSAFYFREMMSGRMLPQEAAAEYDAFFRDSYAILGICVYDCSMQGRREEELQKLLKEFDKNSRYVSRCCPYVENANTIYLFYRITERDYQTGMQQMIQDLQRIAEREEGCMLFVYVGERCEGADEFLGAVENIRRGMMFKHLVPEHAKLEEQELQTMGGTEMLAEAEALEMLTAYAFLADEKNLIQEREALFEQFRSKSLEEMKQAALGIVIAAGKQAEQNNDSLSKIFGSQFNYFDKMKRLEDTRSVRMWITNFLNWILDYSASRLDIKENDVILLAKRYLQDHYDNPELSLSEVAEYVGLNEKYFSNRFTKEAGETVLSYLTGIRMQKAKEILKTTNFKVYEIAEMVGYHNVEHFNRVFKKAFQISPTQFRKLE